MLAVLRDHTFKMSYENHVYLAKLAEQAERYEGESSIQLWREDVTDL